MRYLRAVFTIPRSVSAEFEQKLREQLFIERGFIIEWDYYYQKQGFWNKVWYLDLSNMDAQEFSVLIRRYADDVRKMDIR